MRGKYFWLKILFSAVFVILAMLIMLTKWGKNNIDNQVVMLFFLAFLPWVIKYIKSLEAFGVKAELLPESEKNKIDAAVKKSKIIKRPRQNKKAKEPERKDDDFALSFDEFFKEEKAGYNGIESLVFLRYDLEIKLKALAKLNNINMSKSINQILRELLNNNIINEDFFNVTNDLFKLLNKAVHGDLSKIMESELENIYYIGNKVLSLLDEIKIQLF